VPIYHSRPIEAKNGWLYCSAPPLGPTVELFAASEQAPTDGADTLAAVRCDIISV
jgi:hypothetical protein